MSDEEHSPKVPENHAIHMLCEFRDNTLVVRGKSNADCMHSPKGITMKYAVIPKETCHANDTHQ